MKARAALATVLFAVGCGGTPSPPAGAAASPQPGNDACAAGGMRLVECGYANEPGWIDTCRKSPRYATCMQAQGTSCNGLSWCGFAEFNQVSCGGTPAAASGTAGCEATVACFVACKGDVACLCRCNAEMSMDVAAAVGIQNQCYFRHCQSCGAAGSGDCNQCFAKNCSPGYDASCRGH